MSEGAPMMYHGGGYTGSPGYAAGPADRPTRQYPLDVLQGLGARSGATSSPRRSWSRRDRAPSTAPANAVRSDASAFGYESDDSSLSSNASGSNKSGEKGETSSRDSGDSAAGGGGGGSPGYARCEWRGRPRRDPRPRRTLHDRHTGYPYQVKYTPDDLLTGSEYDTLSQEMWDKFIKSQQTEDTFRKKMNLWRYLYSAIKALFPRHGLYVVGSTMSGFGLESSDMDLCLFVRAPDGADPRAHALLHLSYIHAHMQGFDPGAELIQAKVPILKFRDPRHGLQVDLNCNNVVGVRNTTLLYHFASLDWRVRPLVTVTKLWARAHDINDARHCTLSSYSLTLMVIHFLQCGTVPAVLPRACVAALGGGAGAGGGAGGERARGRSANRASLGELFVQLLGYYAHFPYETEAVSVRLGARLPVAQCRAHRHEPHQWKLLCVEEPFDLTNTARSVYDPDTFERIVATFRRSHARLAAGRRLADAWPSATHASRDAR